MNSSEKPLVVGLGEVLWDCFPDERRPGGAPANFAFHAAQLGLRSEICSRVGGDELGEEFLRYIHEHGLGSDYIQRDAAHSTGRVDVEFNADGEPKYTFVENVAWDHLELDASTRELMGRADAVCFGTLAQRTEKSREMIHGSLAAARPACRLVYDVNLREGWYQAAWIERSLQAAHVVKLNEHEVGVVSRLLAMGRDEPREFARALAGDFDVELTCVSRGRSGCVLFGGDEEVEHGGVEVKAVDPVGAGDAFTAALVFARLQDWPLETSAAFGNEVAARVVARPGAMPDVAAEFAELIERFATT